MKLLIAGSRSITELNLSRYIDKETTLIISGGACGIDRLAEEFADSHKISKLILYPDYKKYGKFAPLKGNETMVNIADKVLIVWDGKSRGSAYTQKYALSKGKETVLIKYSE